MKRSVALSAAATVASGLIALPAAGSAAPPPPIVTAPSGESAHDAWVKFASCMSRALGIRVVVWGPSGGVRIIPPARPQPLATPQQRAAFEAHTRLADARCRPLVRAFTHNSNTARAEASFRDRALRFAVCLRRHGVPVGDPIITRLSGGFDLSWRPAPGVVIGGAQWTRAARACQLLNPLRPG